MSPSLPLPVPFAQHPERTELHGEIHARPPEAQVPPLAIAHIVMLADACEREASRQHVTALLRLHGQQGPAPSATHVRADLGPWRLRWELHTEFVTWTFTLSQGLAPEGGPPDLALVAAPADWLAALPGRCLSHLALWVLPGRPAEASPLLAQMLSAPSLVGAGVAHDAARVYTDFLIRPDGVMRMLLWAADLPPRRLGRLVQRLLEIETYRMVALLGLPVARRASAALSDAELELAALASAIARAARETEPALLDQLTRLAGRIEGLHATTQARLSASAAYFELLDQRLRQISECPLAGLQTLGEFIERRLTPARKTCEWASRRQEALSQRLSRMSELLRTRVEIDQQQSAQALLAALNWRQGMQLKLQSTVEGLSVAAITYYIVGLVAYAAKGLQKSGWPVSPELLAAAAIPVVAGAVWLSLRHLHRTMFGHAALASAATTAAAATTTAGR